MVVFHIGGAANDPFYAKGERIADLLSRRYPDVRVEKHVQHPDKWKSWLQDICRSLGFDHKGTHMVWTGTGRLIGTVDAFAAVVERRYGVKLEDDYALFNRIAEENLAEEVQRIKTSDDEEKRSAAAAYLRDRDLKVSLGEELAQHLFEQRARSVRAARLASREAARFPTLDRIVGAHRDYWAREAHLEKQRDEKAADRRREKARERARIRGGRLSDSDEDGDGDGGGSDREGVAGAAGSESGAGGGGSSGYGSGADGYGSDEDGYGSRSGEDDYSGSYGSGGGDDDDDDDNDDDDDDDGSRSSDDGSRSSDDGSRSSDDDRSGRGSDGSDGASGSEGSGGARRRRGRRGKKKGKRKSGSAALGAAGSSRGTGLGDGGGADGEDAGPPKKRERRTHEKRRFRLQFARVVKSIDLGRVAKVVSTLGDAYVESLVPRTFAESWGALANFEGEVSQCPRGMLNVASDASRLYDGSQMFLRRLAGLAADKAALDASFAVAADWNEDTAIQEAERIVREVRATLKSLDKVTADMDKVHGRVIDEVAKLYDFQEEGIDPSLLSRASSGAAPRDAPQ